MTEGLLVKINADFSKSTVEVQNFVTLMTMNNCECFPATKYQDKHEHWDLIIKFNGTYERIDVKGPKDCIKSNFQWMELRTVDGRDGWLLSRIMDTLVFEYEDYFAFVNRARLYEIVLNKVKEEDMRAGGIVHYFNKSTLENYQRYQRRKDLVVKSPKIDWEHLIDRKLYKDGKLVWLKN